MRLDFIFFHNCCLRTLNKLSWVLSQKNMKRNTKINVSTIGTTKNLFKITGLRLV